MPSAAASARQPALTNLDKPLYPGGFTKGQLIDYYARIAPVMLPHLRGRAATLKRYPNGVDAPFFFEKNCSTHRPDWVRTVRIETRSGSHTNHCLIQDEPTLIWTANLAAIELHVPMALAEHSDVPTAMVFDLDPGEPATLLDCCRVGLLLRDTLRDLGLDCWAKSSGGKGLHVYVPLNTAGVSFEATKDFARGVAELFERDDPKRITATMTRAIRPGKVFIDWSQNDRHKTTACVYSARARLRPTISAPLDWNEIETAVRKRKADALVLETDQVLARVRRVGDLFKPVLSKRQRLPDL